MTYTIGAHYDGRVIVPDEAIDVPVNTPLQVSVTTLSDGGQAEKHLVEERLRRLSRATGCLSGPTIPAEGLRRENLYE